ncbi:MULTISPECIES: LuxR C-terminal-related transcriptional regulator [unclassified Crossiella]|uniref:helix-turn-helix transcriptional regulator n=1 Tax=unclassified Crossiella TaxID=2620835 RepID=UPI001FFE3ABF|nr:MULTISPECIES: LuxR C-terminal-related transcriptional regulator [unclassified Crossiella]MCK2245051.1 LuxR C-terminal-related transcriptional regulator [Crossiella sp. S99.2]MCK2258632.1 LuxR C-terminal-related transcriptional regulator [Crossiella sp. S99.1]
MAIEPRAARRALVETPGPPRPLPDGEVLPPEDYRRLVGVLEAVDRAPDLEAFSEALVRALQTWFGYSTVVVLHGRTLAEALRGGAGVKTGYSEAFLAEYATQWIAADPFLTPKAFALLDERGVVTLGELLAPEHQAYVDGFLRPHGINDKLGAVIDGGAAGVLYVGAVVRGAATVPVRDVAVLRVLRRHLAPLAAEQLGRPRVREWRLTPREREVAELAVQGLTNPQIGRRLFIGADTVKKHLSRVYAETRTATRTQLAVLFRSMP